MAPSSTAVFRAVADFASLNREVRNTRKEIDQLQRQAGTTTGFEKFNGQLDKTAAAQKKLREETKNLNTEQGKLGKSSGLSGLTKQLEALGRAQDNARRSTTDLTAAHTRQQSVIGDAARNMKTLATAAKELGDAEEKATRSAQNHAKSLSDERSSADKKVASVEKLHKALSKLTEEEHAAVAVSSRHADALVREEDSASRASQSHRELSTATRDAGKAAQIAAGDHDLFRESVDRIAPSASRSSAAVRQHESAVTSLGSSSAGASGAQRTLGSAIGSSGASATQASGAHRSYASAVGEGATATERGAEAAERAIPSHRSLGSAIGTSGESAQRSSGQHRTLGTAVQSSTTAIRAGEGSARSATSAMRAFGTSTQQSSNSSRSASSSSRTLASSLSGVGSGARQGSVGTTLLSTSMSPLSSSMRQTGAVGQGLKSVLFGIVPATAVTGIAALIGALSALAGALVSIVAAAGPAVGALAALGPGAVAAAGAVGTVMLAFRGVGDALKASTKLQKDGTAASGQDAQARVAHARAIQSAQRGVRDAIEGQQDAEASGARAIADAQRNLERARRDAARSAVEGARQIKEAQESVKDAESDAADAAVAAARRVSDAQEDYVRATERVKKAEDDLHEARQQAVRDLEDLQARVHDNAETEEGAEIRVLRAKEKLAEVNADATASALDRREAALGLKEAEDSLNDTQRQSKRDQEDLNTAQQSGIDGMEGVVNATDSLTEAQRSQQEAARSVTDAQTAAAKSQKESAERIAKAQENLAETVESVNQRQADSAERIQDAERNLSEARADAAKAQRDAAERVADAQQRLTEAQQDTATSAKGASAASKDLAAAMAKLSPEGKKLVALLLSLQPELDKLTYTAQEAMFPGLIQAIKILQPLIETVAIPIVKAFGTVLGDLAVTAATTFSGFSGDLVSFGTGPGPAMLHDVGITLLNLVSAMEDVGVAAVPLLQWLVKLALTLSEYWKAEAQAGRDNGGLATYFDNVKATLILLGGILYNVGGIIKAVLLAAEPSGKRLLQTFEDLTGQTSEWMKSAEGKNALADYFDKVEHNARTVLDILGKVALAFIKAGKSDSVTKILDAINTKLMPSLEKFFDKLDKSLGDVGPEIVDMLSDLVDIFTDLMGGSGGGFSTFIEVIHSFVEAIKWMVENIPGFKELIKLLGGLAGALLAIKAVGKIGKGLGSGVIGLANGLKKSPVNQALAGGSSRAARAANKGRAPQGSAGGVVSGFRQGATGNQTLPATGTARLGQAAGRGARRVAGSRVGSAVGGAVNRIPGVSRVRNVVSSVVSGRTAAPTGRRAAQAPAPATAPNRRRAGRSGGVPVEEILNRNTTTRDPEEVFPSRGRAEEEPQVGTSRQSSTRTTGPVPEGGLPGGTIRRSTDPEASAHPRAGTSPGSGAQLRTGASPGLLTTPRSGPAPTIEGGSHVLSVGATEVPEKAPAKIPFGFQPAGRQNVPAAEPRPTTTAPVPVKIVPSSSPIPVTPEAPSSGGGRGVGAAEPPHALSSGVSPVAGSRLTPGTVGGGVKVTSIAEPEEEPEPKRPGVAKRAAGAVGRGAKAVGRGVGAFSGELASTGGSIAGGLVGGALGEKVGGETGGMIGSVAGSIAGGMAPDALAAGFAKLGPAVKGAASQVGGFFTSIASGVAGAVASLAQVAGGYIKIGIEAVISGAKQAAAWVVAKGSAIAGLITDLGSAALGYITMGIKAGIAAAQTLAANAAALAVKAGLMAWTAAQWLLNAALDANPIALVVIAIGLLVAALIYAWNNSDTFRAMVMAAWTAISTATSTVFGFIANFITTIWAQLQAVFATASANLSAVWSAMWNVISTTATVVWNGVKLFFNIAIAAFQVAWQAFLMILSGNWSGAWNLISSFAQNVWNAIKAYFAGAWAAFSAAWQGLVNALSKLWTDFWNGMKAVGTTAMDLIKGGLNTAIDFIKNAFKTGVDWIGVQWNRLLALVGKPVNFIIDTVYNNGIVAMWNKVAGWLKLPPLTTAAPVRWGQAEGGAVPITGDKRQGGHNFKSGGGIKGSVMGRDSVPILAQPGEYMLSKSAVDQMGGVGAVDEMHRKAKAGHGPKTKLSPLEKLYGGDLDHPGKGLRGGLFAGGVVPRQMLAGGGAAAALDFARAQVGKPYIWGAVGPAGYDCSGFMSALTNVALGQNPYSRRFATGSFSANRGAGGFVPGKSSAFTIGVSPNTGDGIGHTAGTINGVNVESRGGTGPIVGPSARGTDSSLFPWKFSLPQVGGSFVSGGEGGGAPVNPLIAIINGIVDALDAKLKGLIGSGIDALLPGGGMWADAMKAFPQKLLDEVSKWVKDKASTLAPDMSAGAGTVGTPTTPGTSAISIANSYKRNKGGPIPGVGNRDTVPTMLTPGEYVVNKHAAAAVGFPALAALNSYPQMFAAGGTVSDDYSKYKVKKGDTLTDIAKRFNVSVKNLQDLNKIKDINKIAAGSSLNLPKWASDNTLSEVVRNQKKAARYNAKLKMVTGGWLDTKGNFVSAAGLKPGATIMSDGTVAMFEGGKNVSATKGAGYSYTNGKVNDGYSPKYSGAAPVLLDPSTTSPGTTTPTTSTGEPVSANLTAMLTAVQTNNAEQKEFESNLLTLARWGFDDLALNIQKMGLKSGSGEEGGGGLELSREAVKSPTQAAAIDKELKASKNLIGEDLTSVITIIGALKNKAGMGIREVSTETDIGTDAIFKAMNKAAAYDEVAKLPDQNKTKFLANMTAYKNGVAFATGGRVGGSGNKDTVPAMLTPGEFVLRKSAARALGLPTLHALNNADTQAFAQGGEVLRAEDLFSVLTPTQIQRLGLNAAAKQSLSSALGNNTTNTNNGKNVVFNEGSVQVHNAVPQRSTDSFGSVMQKLSWSGAFS